MTVKNLEGSLQNLANTSIDITDALEEKGETITGLSQAGDAIRRISTGAGDGITTEGGGTLEAIAYDVAINGNLGDLASARGQIGDLPTITDLNVTKTGTYFVENISVLGKTISKAILSVYKNGDTIVQYLHCLNDNGQDETYYRNYNGTSYDSWIRKDILIDYYFPSIPTVVSGNIQIPKGTYIKLDSNYAYFSENTPVPLTISATDRAGKDVYIWVGYSSTGELAYSLSLSSTMPSSFSEARIVGGFHCLCADVGTISGHPLSGYVKGDIIPNSIWTLNHRPVSDPEGMVWVPEIGKWVDIYLPSWNGSKLISKYQGVIADGASSPSFNGSKFAEYAALANKQLISYDEFTVVAKGSNEGTSINGGSDPNTAGGHVDTAGRRMISNYGLEDCCGVLWQWSRTLFEGGATSPTTSSVWRNNAGKATYTEGSMRYYLDNYGWYKESVYNPAFDSQQYGSCSGLLRRALLGGYWGGGSGCGSRAVDCHDFSADGWSDVSARLVSSPRV